MLVLEDAFPVVKSQSLRQRAVGCNLNGLCCTPCSNCNLSNSVFFFFFTLELLQDFKEFLCIEEVLMQKGALDFNFR